MIKKSKLLKSFFYRIYSSIITFLIAYFLTGNLAASISIGVLDSVFKIASYYLFDEIWTNIIGFKAKPTVIWLTGLSGSGKTTIAYSLMEKLKKKSVIPVLLDGDEIRQAIRQTGFDEDSRKKHNRNVGYIASLFEKQGNIVIVSLISPYDDTRKEVRAMCSNFIEVYVATDLDVCIQRDKKGLYKKALTGELKFFTGISAPYHPPINPEIKIDTSKMTVSECSDVIFRYMKK